MTAASGSLRARRLGSDSPGADRRCGARRTRASPACGSYSSRRCGFRRSRCWPVPCSAGQGGSCCGSRRARGRALGRGGCWRQWPALGAAAVAWGVGGGRHLATPATRGGFALGAAALAAAAAYAAGPALARWRVTRPTALALAAAVLIRDVRARKPLRAGAAVPGVSLRAGRARAACRAVAGARRAGAVTDPDASDGLAALGRARPGRRWSR